MSGNSGFHHLKIGDITVTALNDGVLQATNEVLVGITPQDATRELEARFRAVPPRITVNGFLVRSGGRTTLIDTGAGNLMGDAVGHLAANLAAAGVAADEIDAVLLTHLHSDHMAGLVDAEERAAFPNAELVMHEAEAAFWFDDANFNNASDRAKDGQALAKRMTRPYGERIRRLSDGSVMSGISIEKLAGHTPGHSGYLIADGGDALLIWGDIVHIPAVQFPRPEAGVMYDADPAAAQATRRQVFDRAATEKLRVAGMHHEFPCFGHIERSGDGYAFVAEPWMR
jgi:glyoxylase-like metal-dependent hydrolase (beta-lactamase superfamily II)